MKKLVIGILAAVDAGKTTLSEGILYSSGTIRTMGRVDNKNAFLDTYELERARGITIFSKQAELSLRETKITLLDTPGHVDFSAEMERTLQVLDYAILVISGADGVQGHTLTLWNLLKKYQIPVFLFVNKMDQPGTDKDQLLEQIKKNLSEACIDFLQESEDFYESIAMCDECLLEEFLQKGRFEAEEIQDLIYQRKIFPCYFGSALKLEGVEAFLNGIEQYTREPIYSDTFGAKVFKIARDDQGNRLTYMKITGGQLQVRSLIANYRHNEALGRELWEEKVKQIRIYSGEKYEVVSEAKAGTICAVTGLTKTYPGEGLGRETCSMSPILEPVLTYQIQLPSDCDPRVLLPQLKQLEEEEPLLHIIWNEKLQEIQAQVMGEVQIEILKSMILERFHVGVEFGTGNIVYKETIKNKVEGVGHFEPLRHYAEVHLLLEPLERGEGLQFVLNCSEDLLDRNWQRLILTHLEEKEHKGVLTGAAITDMKITLVAGKAHLKHTEGGDFRQATYRAVRQGLKQAESLLLEPFYEYRLEIPETMAGRAMTDMDKMYGTFEISETKDGIMVLTGMAPVAAMQDYQKEVIAYTKGHGRLFCSLKGYYPCHNTEDIITEKGYDSEKDLDNPTGSVFCAHGAGFNVSWDCVENYMHLESQLKSKERDSFEQVTIPSEPQDEISIDIEEIDKILSKTFYSNRKEDGKKYHKKLEGSSLTRTYGTINREGKKVEKKEEYLLVDGYNIIFAWEELSELAKVNVDSARGRLLDILCNYQGSRKCHLIVVFDAYRVQGHREEIMDYHNIHVVYTKEAETADQYIEKFAHENEKKYRITVATSDGLEQIIIRGQGCRLLSARELKVEIEKEQENIRTTYIEKNSNKGTYLFDFISEEEMQKMDEIKKEEKQQ